MIWRKIRDLGNEQNDPSRNLILPVQKTQITKEQALQKARQYCAYSERCHEDVKGKLYSLGLYSKVVNEIIALLIEENFLNEERYAIAFAGGHFRLKKWGRIKIKMALKQKNISTYCIKKAIEEIEETDYEKTLQKLFYEKLKLLKGEKNSFLKKSKMQNYLIQKGYEGELITPLIRNI